MGSMAYTGNMKPERARKFISAICDVHLMPFRVYSADNSFEARSGEMAPVSFCLFMARLHHGLFNVSFCYFFSSSESIRVSFFFRICSL